MCDGRIMDTSAPCFFSILVAVSEACVGVREGLGERNCPEMSCSFHVNERCLCLWGSGVP